MANICIILGKSGTGKSTSIKGLNPDNTVILNILNKRLPFKGSSSKYVEGSNLLYVEESKALTTILAAIQQSKDVHNVVIDDAMYIMSKEYFARAKETGYSKYTELAAHFQQIIHACEGMRSDLNIFFLMHAEDIVSDGTVIEYKVRTIGKLLDSQYNPVEVVPIVLFSDIIFDDKGKASYGFYTHAMMKGAVKIPAKSPDGMFADDWIPNDLGLVVTAMESYYKG